MQREPGEREPDPADEFDRIVSGWQREKSVPAWPDQAGQRDGPEAPPEPDVPADPPPPDPSPAADEGHFVPPDPPPLPRVGPPAAVGIALLTLGLVLVAAPWWVGVPDVYGLPLGLLTLASGLGWLVLRLWPDSPPRGTGDGEDDGAVL